MVKNMVERQTLECVQLEEELRGEEMKAINSVIKVSDDDDDDDDGGCHGN